MPRTKKYGDGTIYYDKTRKRWILQYYNESTKVYKSYLTKKEAQEGFKKIYKNKSHTQRKELLITDLMKENLELKKNTNEISEQQYERVQRTINVIEKSEMLNIELDEITSNEIQSYYNTIDNLSQSSINKINDQFNQSFKYAIIKGYIKENPMINVLKPKSKRDIETAER